MDGIIWFFTNLAMAIPNLFYALSHPMEWLNWADKQALMRFVYYGASMEFFFVVLLLFLLCTIAGLVWRPLMWGYVRGIEGVSNFVGRAAAWAALAMVIQQIMIVLLQRVFRVPEISLGPFGVVFTKDLSWFGEELKLYNAMIVCLCCAYTFVQGGHVRVDLFYAGAKYRTKKIVDMFGSLFFIMPAMVMTWLYGWFFMWRHLITPKVSASDQLDLLMRKARIVKWNVETIGFSPNGFNGYFLFKVLLVIFCLMMFFQAMAFFYRSLLELIEGPESEGKYLDKDQLGDVTATAAQAAH